MGIFIGRHQKVIIVSVSTFVAALILYVIYVCRRKSFREELNIDQSSKCNEEILEIEELTKFPGGEALTVIDILEANGEVVGKSSYGTVYKASLQRCNQTDLLLRFIRPVCTMSSKEIPTTIQLLGSVRHSNLIPLHALYSGPKGEKLLVYPFYSQGNMSRFLQSEQTKLLRRSKLYSISIGIAKGLEHLHTSSNSPIIHGNLKMKNILLDADYQPHLSDFGIHLLLSPSANQEMLEALDSDGYKAPELIKMKDASIESDIYSLGVILLEILSRKKPFSKDHVSGLYMLNIMRNAVLQQKISDVFDPELFAKDEDGNSIAEEEGLASYFQLAMSCCAPSPSLRPDIRYVVKELEQIGSYRK